jgi:phage tail sheath protein FI
MPITPTYPGVYVEEIPSGVHTITGVATSIAAFVDTFERGLVNYAIHLLSMSDFERYMGGLDTTSEGSYAIQQFFLNGGSECYAVRVTGPAAKAAAITLTNGGANIFTITAGQMIGTRTLLNTGAWGNNIRVESDYNTSDPSTQFNLTISEVDSTGAVLRSEVFRNLNMTSGDPAYAVDVVNSGSRMVFLSSPATSGRPVATGTFSGPLPLPLPASAVNGATFTITLDVDGQTASYTATLKLPSAAADYPSLRPYLEAAIRSAVPVGTAPPNNPLLTGATIQLIGNGGTSPTGVPFQLQILAGRAGGSFNPDSLLEIFPTATSTVATDLNLIITANPATSAISNVQQYSLGAAPPVGAQSTPVTGVDDAAITSAAIRGLEASKTGFYALDDVDLFNILCIPAAAKLDSASMQAVLSEGTAYCTTHRAMFIVDIPSSVTDVPGMQTWMAQNDSLRKTNSVVYFPRVRIPDPLNGSRLRDVAPSGTMAGLWAATDVARGVWKAPAGVDVQLVNVPQLVYNLVDRENGVLNPLGINCLRTFPVYGSVSWGARTLFGADVRASEWKYIPIRRLALFLEESLFRGTKWVVFEPNDEPLWAQIRMNVTSFMHDLFRQGAFQGGTPERAYLVKCDSEINTQFEIDRGIVNILVGFAPLKPAEFVILQIQQLAGQTPV